jgi:hypothetical protein
MAVLPSRETPEKSTILAVLILSPEKRRKYDKEISFDRNKDPKLLIK